MTETSPENDGDLYRLVRARHGQFLANPRDIYIGRSLIEFGEYSELEMSLLSQLVSPGAVVAEIGANIGSHTVPLAKLVGNSGKIYAIEAQPIIFQALCANIALNGLLNVVALHEASGSKDSDIWFPDINYLETNNYGGISLDNVSGHTSGTRVDIRPFDRLGLDRLDLMKIDVEGAERDVLKGARETIERCRPVLYLENDRREKSTELIAYIAELGYRLWWHLPPLYNPKNWAGNSTNPWPGIVSCNMLCVHSDKPALIQGLKEVSGTQDHPLGNPSK